MRYSEKLKLDGSFGASQCRSEILSQQYSCKQSLKASYSPITYFERLSRRLPLEPRLECCELLNDQVEVGNRRRLESNEDGRMPVKRNVMQVICRDVREKS